MKDTYMESVEELRSLMLDRDGWREEVKNCCDTRPKYYKFTQLAWNKELHYIVLPTNSMNPLLHLITKKVERTSQILFSLLCLDYTY